MIDSHTFTSVFRANTQQVHGWIVYRPKLWKLRVVKFGASALCICNAQTETATDITYIAVFLVGWSYSSPKRQIEGHFGGCDADGSWIACNTSCHTQQVFKAKWIWTSLMNINIIHYSLQWGPPGEDGKLPTFLNPVVKFESWCVELW